MQENKFTPEDFLPQGTGEENLKKDLEKIRAAGETETGLNAILDIVKTTREADLKNILYRFDIIREYKNIFEQKYQQNLKELKKDVDAGDYEMAAARYEGLYKTLQMVLGNLKQATEELEKRSKDKFAKEKELGLERFKNQSKE